MVHLTLTPHFLHRMYRLPGRRRPPPRSVAVDSTGFSHSTGCEWLSLRFKRTQKRRFTALHAVVDTDTLMVLAAHVRARPGSDAGKLIPLFRRVPHSSLEYVYGERAYISRRNVQHIHDIVAYPAIEPKRRLRSWPRGYKALITEYRRDPERWKSRHRYRRRSRRACLG